MAAPASAQNSPRTLAMEKLGIKNLDAIPKENQLQWSDLYKDEQSKYISIPENEFRGKNLVWGNDNEALPFIALRVKRVVENVQEGAEGREEEDVITIFRKHRVNPDWLGQGGSIRLVQNDLLNQVETILSGKTVKASDGSTICLVKV